MNRKGISLVSLSITVVILLILISTISISINYSIDNAKKMTFAKEIYNIQNLVTEYVKNENTLPPTTETIQIQPSDISQFSEETFVNGKVVLDILDLRELDIKNTNYGNKEIGDTEDEKAKDIYAVSSATGRVYYIAGFKSDETTYYTLTEELLNMIDKKQDFEISEDTIMFVPSIVGWSNEGVTVTVTVPTIFTSPSIQIDNSNISYTTETIDGVTYYTVNSSKVVENYNITIGYIKNGVAGSVTYQTKLDITNPVISKDAAIANTLTHIKGLNATDTQSGIKHFKYVEGAIDSKDVKQYMEAYGKDINKGSIKFEKIDIYTLYAEDKAGNYSFMYIDTQGKLTAQKPTWVYPIIPAGFVVSPYDGEKDWKEGLVIYELADGETAIPETETKEISQTTRNQYVWVPVLDIDEFVTRDGYYDGQPQTRVLNKEVEEPFSKTTSDGITLSKNNDLTGEYAEYEKMKLSVEKHNGFYVARYEAGDAEATAAGEARTGLTSARTVVSRKNAQVYCYVLWGESMVDVDLFTRDGVENVAGAVYLSRSIYPESANNDVVSHLIYGVEWDAVMNFMKDVENASGTKSKYYIYDSTNMGRYLKASPALSGTDINASASNKVKNIYDMAGNLNEWTMEAYLDNARVVRGGYHRNGGSSNPASARGTLTPNNLTSTTSFRVALYLK